MSAIKRQQQEVFRIKNYREVHPKVVPLDQRRFDVEHEASRFIDSRMDCGLACSRVRFEDGAVLVTVYGVRL